MLQKLEDLYLVVLRFVAIVMAGVLLVAMVSLGVSSLKALQPPPEAPWQPVVYGQALKKGLLMDEAEKEGEAEAPARARAVDDPRQRDYERAASAMADFVATHSGGRQVLSTSKLVDFIRQRAEEHSRDDLKNAFAKGLADHMEALLKDEDVIWATQGTPAGDIVDRLFHLFDEAFEESLREIRLEHYRQQTEYEARKEEGKMQLYAAAGTLAGFLVLVFLSVAVRLARQRRTSQPSA